MKRDLSVMMMVMGDGNGRRFSRWLVKCIKNKICDLERNHSSNE